MRGASGWAGGGVAMRLAGASGCLAATGPEEESSPAVSGSRPARLCPVAERRAAFRTGTAVEFSWRITAPNGSVATKVSLPALMGGTASAGRSGSRGFCAGISAAPAAERVVAAMDGTDGRARCRSGEAIDGGAGDGVIQKRSSCRSCPTGGLKLEVPVSTRIIVACSSSEAHPAPVAS